MGDALIGYLYLALVLFCGVTKGYCGKKTSSLTRTLSDAVAVNLLRMTICVLIGGVLALVGAGVNAFAVSPRELFTAALSGVFSALFVISWMLSVRRGAYMMVEVFLLLGSILPILLSAALYGETISLWQVVGFCLLALATYIMSTYNARVKTRFSVGALLLLLLCGLANGVADFSQKLFAWDFPEGQVSVFQFYSFIFSALVLFVWYLVLRARGEKETGEASITKSRAIYIYIPIMAAALFLHAYFKTTAASYLDAVKLYPITQGGSMVLSLFMAQIFFGERITPRCVLGIAVTFGAMLLINFC